MPRNRWGVVIVAAGTGTRFGGTVPKQFTLLAGKPVIEHSVAIFRPFSDHLVVVTPQRDWRKWWDPPSDVSTIPGGKRRQDSVMNGLGFLQSEGVTHVLIHDGARPLVDPGCIKRVMEATKRNNAVIPVIPVRDTVKRVDEDKDTVLGTLNRQELRLSQTPQGFHLEKLMEVLDEAGDVTDEASAFEAAGEVVLTVAGNRSNIKITMFIISCIQRHNSHMIPGDKIIATIIIIKYKCEDTIQIIKKIHPFFSIQGKNDFTI